MTRGQSAAPVATTPLVATAENAASSTKSMLTLRLFSEIPELRRLTTLEPQLQFNADKWDPQTSPQTLQLFDDLRVLVSNMATLPQNQQMHGVKEFAESLREVGTVADGIFFDRLLDLIVDVTASPDQNYKTRPDDGFHTSTEAWDAFVSHGTEVEKTLGTQWLSEDTSSRGFGYFDHGKSLDLRYLSGDPRSTPCSLDKVLKLWIKKRASDADVPRVLYGLGRSSLHFSHADEQRISRLSSCLVVRVDRNLTSQSLETFDFGPYTSFHPLSNHKEDVDHVYSMWHWKPGTSIPDFKVLYQLVAAMTGPSSSRRLLLRCSPVHTAERARWTVFDGPEASNSPNPVAWIRSPKKQLFVNFLIFRKAPDAEAAANESEETTQEPSIFRTYADAVTAEPSLLD